MKYELDYKFCRAFAIAAKDIYKDANHHGDCSVSDPTRDNKDNKGNKGNMDNKHSKDKRDIKNK